MGARYSKQPNGKFCRVSSIVDAFTDINMTEDEFRQDIINRNYCDCCDSSGHLSEQSEQILKKEIETPVYGGELLTTFDDCLEYIRLYNYSGIDELHNILRKTGYEKWETFEPYDYSVGQAEEKVFKEHFDEYRDSIIQFLIEDHTGENYDPDHYKKYGLSNDGLIEKIKSIKTYKDFEDNAHLFDDISVIVEYCSPLTDLVDYKALGEKYYAQFEHSKID